MNRPVIPDSKFSTDGWSHAVVCAVSHGFWNNTSVEEIYRLEYELNSKIANHDMANAIKSVLQEIYPKVACNFITYRDFLVHAGDRLYISCRNCNYRDGSSINEYRMEIVGSEDEATAVRDALRDRLGSETLVKVSWYYKTNNGIDSSHMHVTGNKQPLRDEFYPWLKNGVNSFMEDYIKSDASILVMYGPPGTGKTSFLRHLLVHNNVNAMVTYDERVLSDDAFFVDYLTDEQHDVLIVEDADVFLAPREGASNHMMSRFLNVSDGLIRIPHKKMIFTTNISHLNRIDQALLRPGRCYAAVEFRELMPAEAAEAARAAHLPEQDWSRQDRWSLAQLWGGKPAVEEQPKQKFGFV